MLSNPRLPLRVRLRTRFGHPQVSGITTRYQSSGHHPDQDTAKDLTERLVVPDLRACPSWTLPLRSLQGWLAHAAWSGRSLVNSLLRSWDLQGLAGARSMVGRLDPNA